MAEEHKKLTQEDLMQRARERKESGSPGRSGEEIIVKGTAEEKETYNLAHDAITKALYVNSSPPRGAKQKFSETALLMKKLTERMTEARNDILSFPNSPHFERLQQLFPDIHEWTTEGGMNEKDFDWFLFQGIIEFMDELMPHIETVMKQHKAETGRGSMSFGEFTGWAQEISGDVDVKEGEENTGENPDSQEKKITPLLTCLRMAKYAEENLGEKEIKIDLQLFSASLEAEAKAATWSISDELEAMIAIQTTRHISPNNALINKLQSKPAINAGPFDLDVMNPKGKNRGVTSYTVVSYDEESAGFPLKDKRVTATERTVYDAICSIWVGAERQGLPPNFTIDDVHRNMPGGGDKPSEGRRKELETAIEKLRGTKIFVDATEEMRKRGVIEEKESCEFDDYCVSVTRVKKRISNGGQTVTAYHLNSKPIILRYSEMARQVIEIDKKYIEVRKVKNGNVGGLISMSKGRPEMVSYMVRRVEAMKRDKKNKIQKQSNVILFDTLFENSGNQTENRKQKMNNRNFCFDVLDYWKVTGFIKGYSKQTKGRSITGVIIDL